MAEDGYTQELHDAIIQRLMEGRSLLAICRDPDIPSHATVLRWRKKYPDFDEAIPRARAEGTHVLAEQCLEIADDKEDDVQHRRLRIDTRLRLIGKWNARAYGDKVAVGGADDLPPVQIEDTGARDKLASLVARRLAATGPDGGSGGAD